MRCDSPDNQRPESRQVRNERKIHPASCGDVAEQTARSDELVEESCGDGGGEGEGGGEGCGGAGDGLGPGGVVAAGEVAGGGCGQGGEQGGQRGGEQDQGGVVCHGGRSRFLVERCGRHDLCGVRVRWGSGGR